MSVAKSRKIVPLSVKMMFATALLLVAVAASALFFSRSAIHDLSEQYTESRRAAGEVEIQNQAEALARNLSTAAGLPMAEGNYTYLTTLVETRVGQDQRVAWLLIADAETGTVVARSSAAPPGEQLDDALSEQVMQSGGDDVSSVRDPGDPSQLLFGAKVLAGSRVVGQLRLAFSTTALEEELAAAIAAGKAHEDQAQSGLLRLAAAALLAGLIIAFFQAYRTTRPIKMLSDQAARIAGGELDHRVQVGSRDEIGLLADNFNYMAEQLGVLLSETAAKASLEREMSLARDIQEAMHPPGDVIAHGRFRVAGYLESADACGGDWWTVRTLSDDRMLIVVGDVTGHGLPAAMITASARGAVEALSAVQRDDEISPESVLLAIDRAVSNVGHHALYMTCFAAVVNPGERVIRFANAGHNFPYLLRQGDPKGGPALRSLTAAGNPLGNPRHRLFQTREAELVPGDLLVFYTDGLVDRINETGGRFGDKRLRQLLAATTLDASNESLVKMRDDIVGQVAAFGAGFPADDDVTIVLCHYLSAQAATGAVGLRAG